MLSLGKSSDVPLQAAGLDDLCEPRCVVRLVEQDVLPERSSEDEGALRGVGDLTRGRRNLMKEQSREVWKGRNAPFEC